MASRLTLGINSCFAVKRWPEPARWVELVVDQLGLRACQVSLDLFDASLDPASTARYAATLEREAAAAGLVLHSTFTGLVAYAGNLLLHPERECRVAGLRWFERAIALTASLGAAGCGGFLGALSMADAADPARRHLLEAELVDSLHHLSEVAGRAGLGFLLFENMAVERELGHSIEEARRLEAAADRPGGRAGGVPWRLCLDLGHPCALRTGAGSDDPLAWLAAGWRRTPVLQIQQANRDGDFHWPFTDRRNREGLVRADRIVEALGDWPETEEIFLFLEVIHPHEYPDELVLADLSASVGHWLEALGGGR